MIERRFDEHALQAVGTPAMPARIDLTAERVVQRREILVRAREIRIDGQRVPIPVHRIVYATFHRVDGREVVQRERALRVRRAVQHAERDDSELVRGEADGVAGDMQRIAHLRVQDDIEGRRVERARQLRAQCRRFGFDARRIERRLREAGGGGGGAHAWATLNSVSASHSVSTASGVTAL